MLSLEVMFPSLGSVRGATKRALTLVSATNSLLLASWTLLTAGGEGPGR